MDDCLIAGLIPPNTDLEPYPSILLEEVVICPAIHEAQLRSIVMNIHEVYVGTVSSSDRSDRFVRTCRGFTFVFLSWRECDEAVSAITLQSISIPSLSCLWVVLTRYIVDMRIAILIKLFHVKRTMQLGNTHSINPHYSGSLRVSKVNVAPSIT